MAMVLAEVEDGRQARGRRMRVTGPGGQPDTSLWGGGCSAPGGHSSAPVPTIWADSCRGPRDRI